MVHFIPTILGSFVLAVRVDAYDPNTGAQTNSITRDFQMLVINLASNPTSVNGLMMGGNTISSNDTLTINHGDSLSFNLQMSHSNVNEVLSFVNASPAPFDNAIVTAGV